MKPIFVFLFIFAVGSLALKIQAPKDGDGNEGLDSAKAESIGERISVRSVIQDAAASTIKKRAVGNHDSGRWKKANSSPVCFGAKNSQYGKFYAPSRGKLAAVKLVHLYGYVYCSASSASYLSFWGCGNHPSVGKYLAVVITTSKNHILLPPSQFFTYRSGAGRWSAIAGYNSHSQQIILSFYSHPYWVNSGEELRLWYGEDLVGYTEYDNGGRVCADVYALYV